MKAKYPWFMSHQEQINAKENYTITYTLVKPRGYCPPEPQTCSNEKKKGLKNMEWLKKINIAFSWFFLVSFGWMFVEDIIAEKIVFAIITGFFLVFELVTLYRHYLMKKKPQ